jgi:diacylglycerol kinase (ATP)
MTQFMSQQLSTKAPSGPSKINSPTLEISSPELEPLDREYAWQVASNLFVSFKYAWAGVSYAFHTQRNFRIHVVLGSIAIFLGLALHLTAVEVAVIGLTVGAVLTMELLNTALESVVDLTVRQTYHELAKIAKDCAAGAVLISALASILVAGSLLLPPLWVLLRDAFI